MKLGYNPFYTLIGYFHYKVDVLRIKICRTLYLPYKILVSLNYIAVLKTNIRLRLQEIYPEQELACWFDPLYLQQDTQQTCIQVIFPHSLFGQWFMRLFHPVFEEHARFICKDLPFIYKDFNGTIYCVKTQEVPENKEQIVPAINKTVLTNTKVPFSQISTSLLNTLQDVQNNLTHNFPLHIPDPNHLFSSFLTNKKNAFPVAAAQQAINIQPLPSQYVPFTIYGQSGAGKTHFLAAMANAIHKLNSEITIYYGNIDQFFNIKLPLYKSKRAFFLDEAQRILNIPEMYENIITFFDTCRGKNIHIVLSFDAHPSTYKELPQKILSRITGGLIVEIKKPDLDIRYRYIHAKNDYFSFNLTKEQELILAQRFQDFRSIDGIIARMLAYKSTSTSEQDLAIFLEKGTHKKILTAEDIISHVSKYFSISEQELIGKNRNQKSTMARQIAIFLIRDLLGLSLLQIGKIFSGRDHSSIIYSLKKIEQIQESNKDTNIKITNIKKMLLINQP